MSENGSSDDLALDAGPQKQGRVSRNTAAVAGGAVVGASGGYAIFTIAHLDEILSRTGNTDIGMFYALACLSALGLLAIFMNSQVLSTPTPKISPISMIVTSVFGLFVVAAICVLGYRTIFVPGPVACSGPGCAKNLVEKNKLHTVFDNYADVAGFSFPINSLPGGPSAIVKASMNDGAPHLFDKDGKVSLDLEGGDKRVTVSVENLKALEGAFSGMVQKYNGLLKQQERFASACRPQAETTRLTGECRILFTALISSSGTLSTE